MISPNFYIYHFKQYYLFMKVKLWSIILKIKAIEFRFIPTRV